MGCNQSTQQDIQRDRRRIRRQNERQSGSSDVYRTTNPMEITRPSEQSVDTAADDDTKEYGTSLTNKNTQEQERLQNILKNFIDVQHRDGADRDGERNSFTERIDYEEQISKLVVYHSVLPDLPVDQLQAPDANSIKNMLSFPSASSSDSKSNDTDNSIKDVGKIVLTFDEL